MFAPTHLLKPAAGVMNSLHSR